MSDERGGKEGWAPDLEPGGFSPSLVRRDQPTVVLTGRLDLEGTEAEAQPTLEILSGDANQQVIHLGSGNLSIGRAIYNDLILHDQKVSRKHASIGFDKGDYLLEDLNSTNGVYVDGERVSTMRLHSGNRIAMGDSLLLFTQPLVEVSLVDKMAFINASDLFNWLDEDTRQLLARSLVVRSFPENTVIIHQNTQVESLYFLYSGGVRVVEINDEGGERILDHIQAGDVFGERSLIAGESGGHSMIANSDSYVLELQKERLNELLQKKPELNKAFYRMLLKRISAVPGVREERRMDQERLRPASSFLGRSPSFSNGWTSGW